jgi:hypothetical protein
LVVVGWGGFFFSDPGDSYAARTGRPDDLGVIGVALFRERVIEPQPWSSGNVSPGYPAAREKAAEAPARSEASDGRLAGAAAPAPAAQAPSLGTGHGRGEYSPVQPVEFERASSRPDQLVAIRYERRETLVAMGVLPRVRHSWRDPDPFPGTLSFVPDP